MALSDGAQQFRDFAREHGYELPADLIPGKRARFATNGKVDDDAGWCLLFPDLVGGVLGDWRTGTKLVWQARQDRQLSPDEWREWQERIEREKREADAERQNEANSAAARAEAIWKSAMGASADHPYLRRKGIGPSGAKVYSGEKLTIRGMDCEGALIVPLRNAATQIRSLEFIGADGDKRFLPGGAYQGCYFGIGSKPKDGQPLCIAEGFATGATIHEATGHPVVTAMTAGNLEAVARSLREKYPSARLIVCADDDAATPGNPGITKAREAVRAIGGLLALPDFGGERPDGATDFNDLQQAKGAQMVAQCIARANLAQSEQELPAQPEKAAARLPLDWPRLAALEPPERQWAIKGWLGFGHITLLAGNGSIGKTLLAQQAASSLALGQPFIDDVPGPLKVLMWCCEDDHDELWRRQVAIARWLDARLDAFAENLVIVPRHGLENALVTSEYGRPMFTGLIEELRQQAGDVGAQVVMLDNVAQLYGGSENDRHSVTVFLNGLAGALPGRAILLLSHPARAAGSEFSGSSAWENTARTRLYLGDRLPDQKPEQGDEPADDVRYLSRRKANYSNRDWRRFTFNEGVLVPDAVEAAAASGGIVGHLRDQAAERIVLEGLKRLQGMGIHAMEATNSANYLPRLLIDYKLSEGRSKPELAAAMRRLRTGGQIDQGIVGKYSNRSPKYGLVVR